jgi:hypothetical protein
LLIAKLLLPSTKIPLYELEYDKTYIFTDKAYDERYEDIPGVVDCYNDGYEAGFAQKYDGNRANECINKGDQYNVGFGYGCIDGGLTKEDCDNVKEENDSDLGDHEQLEDKNMETCYNDGYDDGQNNPFDQDRNKGCDDYSQAYYDGFIEGCISADNTREICVSATDA